MIKVWEVLTPNVGEKQIFSSKEEEGKERRIILQKGKYFLGTESGEVRWMRGGKVMAKQGG